METLFGITIYLFGLGLVNRPEAQNDDILLRCVNSKGIDLKQNNALQG